MTTILKILQHKQAPQRSPSSWKVSTVIYAFPYQLVLVSYSHQLEIVDCIDSDKVEPGQKAETSTGLFL